MRAWSEWGLWSWAGTATQANAGGGTIIIDVTAGIGNVIEILYARFVGTFGASDDLNMEVVDEDNNRVFTTVVVTASGTLNVTFPRANTDVDSTTSVSASRISGLTRIFLAGSDLKFTASTSTLAQNDTVQVLILAKVKRGPGTISVARSGGTVAAPTVTVNEVY